MKNIENKDIDRRVIKLFTHFVNGTKDFNYAKDIIEWLTLNAGNYLHFKNNWRCKSCGTHVSCQKCFLKPGYSFVEFYQVMQWKMMHFGRPCQIKFSNYDVNKYTETEILSDYIYGYDIEGINLISGLFNHFSPNKTTAKLKITHSQHGYEFFMQYSTLKPELLMLHTGAWDKFRFVNSRKKDKSLFGKVDVIFLN